jgi:hypothetical protein
MDFTGAAFLISLISLAISIKALFATKDHNRLSVRPYINIIHEKSASYEKQQQTLVGTLTIVLINNGIGPAIVESLDLFVDGQRIMARDDQKWEYALKKLFPVDRADPTPEHFGFGVFNLSKGYCIPARERITLFSIKFTMNMSQITQEALDRSQIVLVYKSFYKMSYTYDSDKVKRGEIDAFE